MLLVSLMPNISQAEVYPQSSIAAFTFSGSFSPVAIMVVAAPIDTPCRIILILDDAQQCSLSIQLHRGGRSSPLLWNPAPNLRVREGSAVRHYNPIHGIFCINTHICWWRSVAVNAYNVYVTGLIGTNKIGIKRQSMLFSIIIFLYLDA